MAQRDATIPWWGALSTFVASMAHPFPPAWSAACHLLSFVAAHGELLRKNNSLPLTLQPTWCHVSSRFACVSVKKVERAPHSPPLVPHACRTPCPGWLAVT